MQFCVHKINFMQIKNIFLSSFRHIFLFFILKQLSSSYLDSKKSVMEELLEIQNKIYQVETKVLKQTVRRNCDRFPEDFMFELTEKQS